MMLRLKMGVESGILWSEIGSGFGDPFQQFLKGAYPLSLPLRTRVSPMFIYHVRTKSIKGYLYIFITTDMMSLSSNLERKVFCCCVT